MQDGERQLEHDFGAVEEEAVDQIDGRVERHRADEEREEPGERYVADHAQLLQLVVDVFQVVLAEVLEHARIDLSADHFGVVVVGQEAFADAGEQPEGVLLVAVEQQHAGDQIHGLTVADARIAHGVGLEHATQGVDADLALEGDVLGQRAMQVLLDLVHGDLVLVGRLLRQRFVQQRVGLLLVHGAGEDEPHLAAMLVGQALEYELVQVGGAVEGDAATVLGKVALERALLETLALLLLVRVAFAEERHQRRRLLLYNNKKQNTK